MLVEHDSVPWEALPGQMDAIERRRVAAGRPARAAAADLHAAGMLATDDLIAFVATADPGRARAFYADTLGLPLEDEPLRAVFRANGPCCRWRSRARSRRTRTPSRLGGRPTFAGRVRELCPRRRLERYEGMEQDGWACSRSSSGARYHLAKDPDGSTLFAHAARRSGGWSRRCRCGCFNRPVKALLPADHAARRRACWRPPRRALGRRAGRRSARAWTETHLDRRRAPQSPHVRDLEATRASRMKSAARGAAGTGARARRRRSSGAAGRHGARAIRCGAWTRPPFARWARIS